MKYFVNDAEVTETEYNRIMREQRKVVKVTAAPKATYTAGKKSKIDQAIEIVASMNGSSKEQIVSTLMVKLGGITKGNATIYYTKALAKGA